MTPSKNPSKRAVRLIAVTGGIASGKSLVCRRLEAAGHQVFYCDDEAKRIIRTDPEIRPALRRIVGNEVYDTEGRLNKSRLAAFLCRGKAFASQVDAVVHPRVATAFLERAAACLTDSEERAVLPETNRCLTMEALERLPVGSVLFMECALLFESGFDRLTDCSVLIHAGLETRLRRLMVRDGITREQALRWIALQMDEEEKLRRADYVINNETERFR